MAIRDKLNRKRKKSLTITFAFWGIALLIPFIGVFSNMKGLAFGIIVFCCTGGVMAYLHHYFCVLCPKCKNRLGFIVFSQSKHLFRISEKISFCPYCGSNFDE